MGETRKDYIVDSGEMGAINLSEDVVAAIAVNAALEVEGVGALNHNGHKKNAVRGVKLTVGEGEIMVDLQITVHYGHPIPQVARTVQDAVANAVESMTELKVSQVNVRISNVTFGEESA